MFEELTYSVTDPKLRKPAAKAAAQWNDVLKDLVYIKEVASDGDVLIQFGKIDLIKYPNRIAQCSDRRGKWIITLGDHVSWASSAFERLFGIGKNMFAAIVHEFGHVFDLPHASDPDYIMHPQLINNGVMMKKEKEQYRAFFVNSNN